ncbi:MAG TPA: (d)CMP kinase, partial [Eubacteriaceae bacterium]|nr:(d)CMP kinase [Eubacteriaceae bacterium]
GTIAKLLAQRLNVQYLDTGAMYRAATLHVLNRGIPLEDSTAIVDLIRKTSIDFIDNRIHLNGKDVSIEIRQPKVNNTVSVVAQIKEVRKIMVDKQREIACKHDVIMDGRDIGTVVLPNAEYKFYLDASIEVRAKRRYKEWKEQGIQGDYEALKQSIKERDERDENRKEGPLAVASDAVVVDTSNKNIDEVVSLLIDKIGGKTDGL